MPYEFTSHTADVAVELRAASREALFADALVAFTDTVTDPERVAPEEEHELAAEADDLESLMVEWLGELVYRFDVDGLLFRDAAVRIEEVPGGGYRLAARARGEPFDTGRHRLEVQVKGVTYHELRVEKADDGWVGRVVFDI